jgi:hypothetical protein
MLADDWAPLDTVATENDLELMVEAEESNFR